MAIFLCVCVFFTDVDQSVDKRYNITLHSRILIKKIKHSFETSLIPLYPPVKEQQVWCSSIDVVLTWGIMAHYHQSSEYQNSKQQQLSLLFSGASSDLTYHPRTCKMISIHLAQHGWMYFSCTACGFNDNIMWLLCLLASLIRVGFAKGLRLTIQAKA